MNSLNYEYIYNYIIKNKSISQIEYIIRASFYSKRDILIDEIKISNREAAKLYFDYLMPRIDDFHDIIKENKKNEARYYRLKSRVADILENEAYFITLTLRDEYLDSKSKKYLKSETLRKYVKNCLKKCSYNYCANIDYAPMTNRIHFHALCNLFDMPSWKYGFIDVKKVRLNHNQSDINRLSKYISKLTNHAIKNDRNYFIYSRTKKT